jgi:hypothetical protein
MSAEAIMRTIQLIVAPVVMISACAVFVGGLLSHYEAINGRMRSMARERLELLRSSREADRFASERLAELDTQLPQLVERHALVHHSLLAAYTGILILVASMCAIAFSAVVAAEWLVGLVLAMFVAGILGMLLSVILIALEVRTSQRAVTFEVQRVLRIAGEPGRVTRTDVAGTVLSKP